MIDIPIILVSHKFECFVFGRKDGGLNMRCLHRILHGNITRYAVSKFSLLQIFANVVADFFI